MPKKAMLFKCKANYENKNLFILIQSGAEETHVFHIRITLFIFNIKSFNYTKKRRYFNAFLKYIPNYVRKVMSVR